MVNEWFVVEEGVRKVIFFTPLPCKKLMVTYQY